MNNATRAAELLKGSPMTRESLERALGISQQRVSEALRRIDGVRIVGYAKPRWKGNLSPIYGFEEAPPEWAPCRIGKVSSVWELGA